jgi:hypothetical protein
VLRGSPIWGSVMDQVDWHHLRTTALDLEPQNAAGRGISFGACMTFALAFLVLLGIPWPHPQQPIPEGIRTPTSTPVRTVPIRVRPVHAIKAQVPGVFTRPALVREGRIPVVPGISTPTDGPPDEMRNRSREVQLEVEKIVAELARIDSRLLETGKLIQQSEAQLGLIESRLGDLEAQERQIRGSLEERHGSISTPDALALSERVNALVRIMTSIRTEGDKLRVETERLRDAHARLSGLRESKRQLLAVRQAELERDRSP